MKEIWESCTNCDLRHGGCVKSDEELRELWETNEKCSDFIAGKCFYCALYQLDDQSQCLDVFYPCGCINFKEGQGYSEYLAAVEKYSNPDVLEEPKNDEALKARQQVRNKYADRRKSTKRAKKRLLRKAKECSYFLGPWFNEKKQRVEICGRGKRSKFLKRQTYKKARRMDPEKEEKLNRGLYHRIFDYWWEID